MVGIKFFEVPEEVQGNESFVDYLSESVNVLSHQFLNLFRFNFLRTA